MPENLRRKKVWVQFSFPTQDALSDTPTFDKGFLPQVSPPIPPRPPLPQGLISGEKYAHTESQKKHLVIFQQRWKNPKMITPSLSRRFRKNTFSQGFLWLCWDKQEVVAHAHIDISLLHLHDCWMLCIRIVEVT